MFTHHVHGRSVCLETQFAFYTLKKPSWQYATMYNTFYRPHRIAQLAISMAISDPDSCTTDMFKLWYADSHDELLGEVIEEQHIVDAVSTFICHISV